MLELYDKSQLRGWFLGVSLAFFFGFLVLPTLSGIEHCDCENGCDDHGSPVCDCIGCFPVSPACEVLVLGLNPVVHVSSLSTIDRDNGHKCEFFDRLDRPPRFPLS